MTGEFSTGWLSLREPADAGARAAELLDPLRSALKGRPELVVRDLGCGTGSLGRWLAPRLPGPQRWVMEDRDPALLAYAATHMPAAAEVTVETKLGDVTAVTAADLAGTDLVTCSALLDILTAGEVEALVRACADAGTPALFTLSVAGQVTLDPPRPADASVAAAFDEHQRRVQDGRRLLGPDAPAVAVAAFEKAGARVVSRPSPWHLGPASAALTKEWLRGWVAAAAEQRPDQGFDAYLEARLADLPRAVVGHVDLLAIFG
jgi:SAM-dependent methyltransferase